MAKRNLERVGSEPRLNKIDAASCELCLREVDGYTVHNLVPRSKGGLLGPTSTLCSICHRQTHALFSEATFVRPVDNHMPAVEPANEFSFDASHQYRLASNYGET